MTKRSASLTRKGRFSEYYFNRALAAADSIEYSPFDELSRNIERRMITDTIRVKILCKNSLFTKVNISEIARSTCGSQLFVVTAGTIDVYNANNFKRKIKNQHKREQIEEKDVLMKINQNGFATIYKDLKGELYLIEDDVNVLLSIKQRRFKRSETYFDTFRNEFAETDSCRCPECNAAEQHKRRTFLKRDTGKNLRWFTKSKRSRTTPFPSRPISLQSVNKTQYGVTVSNCIASPLSNTSYENERYPVIAQPSDQGAEESSYPFSIQRNTSTDGLSFYRPHYSGLPSRLSNTSSRSQETRKYSNSAHEKYSDAKARKESFQRAWPRSEAVQNTDRMVQYGFFNTGTEDLVRCYHCGIGLKDWGGTDDPLMEHARYSPDCQFLVDTTSPSRLREIKGSFLPNVTISTRESAASSSSVSNARGSEPDQETIELPVQPRSPQYSRLSARLSSFSKWPRDISQTPQELAEAGFFYTGCNDIVRCYVCDGGLQKWSPGDSAWVEHARWFAHCAYVLELKGRDFIELVRLSAEHEDFEEEGAAEGAGGYAAVIFDDDLASGISRLNVSEPGQQRSSKWNAVIRSVREVTGCSEERIARAIEIMDRAGQDINENIVAEYLLDLKDTSMLGESRTRSNQRIQNEPESVEELQEETEKLRSIIKCFQCRNSDANCLFLPCAHHRFCMSCSIEFLVCPFCKKKINHRVKTFMS